MSEIRELVQRLVNDMDGMRPTIVTGTVKDVDAGTWTCTVEVEGDYTRNGVRMRAIEDGTVKGFILKPKVGSDVTIKMAENDRNLWFLDMVSEVDEVYLLSDANGGVPIAENIKNKLNALEDKVNSIESTLATHVHTGGTISGSTGPITPALVPQPLTNTQTSDLESTTVKHG